MSCSLVQYDLVATSPSGVAYEKGDRVALVLAYEFMKAFDQTTDGRDPLFWVISRSFAKKHDILKFDSSQPLHTFAVSDGMEGDAHTCLNTHAHTHTQ